MSQARVHFLGTGDAFGSGGRFQTCFHVTAGSTQFLIDCGASAPLAMKRFGVDLAQLDCVLISHFHGDHYGGLPFLAVEEGIFHRRKAPLVVVGPRGVRERVGQAAEALFPGSTGASGGLPLRFVEYSERQPTEVGNLKVQVWPVVHSAGTEPHALRIQCMGKMIGYSGDTEWTENLIPVAAKADLFICEAYFFEKKVPKHLDYRTLAAHRSRLDCQKLMLTHFHDDMLQHLSAVDEECAEDGKLVEI